LSLLPFVLSQSQPDALQTCRNLRPVVEAKDRHKHSRMFAYSFRLSKLKVAPWWCMPRAFILRSTEIHSRSFFHDVSPVHGAVNRTGLAIIIYLFSSFQAV